MALITNKSNESNRINLKVQLQWKTFSLWRSNKIFRKITVGYKMYVASISQISHSFKNKSITKQNENKHNAELQRADPRPKDMG